MTTGFEHFAEDTFELSLAGIRSLDRWDELFFGPSENTLSFENSADVSLHPGRERRFQ